jgi:fucose permease
LANPSPANAAGVPAERSADRPVASAPSNASLLTVASCITFAAYGATMTVTGPAIPSIARHFGLSLGQVGAIFGAGGVGFVLVVFLAGYASDSIGKRGVMLAGIAAILAGMFGVGLAPTFAIVALAMFVQNIGNGLLESGIGALVVDLNPTRRTTALNVLHASFGAGALVGPLFAGALIAAGNWQLIFIGSGIAFVVLLLALYPQRFPKANSKERIEWRQIGELIRSRTIQLAAAAIMLYVAAELSLSAWAFPYLESVRGYPTLVASLGVSLFWLGIAVGRGATAWVARFVAPARIIQFGSLLFAAGSLALLATPSAVTALVALALSGLGAAAIYPTIMAICCARYPNLSGSVTGLITTATGVGILFGPWVVGWLGDVLGLQSALVAVSAMMVVVVGIYQVRAADGA